MTSRFDNLPTEELFALERQMRCDQKALTTLLRERVKSESLLRPGYIYRIVKGRLAGRQMLLSSITLGGGWSDGDEKYQLAEGPLDNRASKAGDGWGIRHQQTLVSNLEPEPIGKGPRW